MPSNVEDANYRLIFETNDNGIVYYIRAGLLPEVEMIEGCL